MGTRIAGRNMGGSLRPNTLVVGYNLAYNSAFLVGTNDFTISFWIRVSSQSVAAASTHSILDYAPASGYGNGFIVSQYGSTLYLYLKGGGGPTLTTFGFFTGRVDRWVHITFVCVRSTAMQYLYADGALVNAVVNSAGSWNITEPATFSIGASVFVSVDGSSLIGQVRFFNGHAFTAREVFDLYKHDVLPASVTPVIEANWRELRGTSMTNDGSCGGTFTAVTSTGWSLETPERCINRNAVQNMLLYSNTLTNSAWTASGCSVVADGSTPFDTINSAWKFTENSATSSHVLISASGLGTLAPLLVGQQVTFEAVVKGGGGRNWCAIAGNAGAVYSFFNLSTGAQGTNTGVTFTKKDLGNGWWRIGITFTADSSDVRIYMASADGAASYAGDGSSYIRVCNLSLRLSSRPAGYINTTSRPVVYGPSSSFGVEQNLILYSNQLQNAAWTKAANVSCTDNNATAPDGTLTATTIDATSAAVATGVHQMISASYGAPIVRSVWVKGTAGETISITDPASSLTTTTVTFDGTWQRVAQYDPVLLTAGTCGIWIRKGTANQWSVWHAQVHYGTRMADYAATTSIAVNTGSPRGLSPKANCFTQSADLTNVGSWPRTGLTGVTSIGNVGPGGRPAFRLQDSAGAGGHYISQTFGSVVAGRIYTVKVDAYGGGFVKSKNFLGLAPDGASTQVGFNLLTYATQVNVNFLKYARAYAYDLGGGWTRCVLTYQSDGFQDVRLYMQDVIGSVSYTADGLGTIQFTAPQLTEGPAEASDWLSTAATASSGYGARGLVARQNLLTYSNDPSQWTATGGATYAADGTWWAITDSNASQYAEMSPPTATITSGKIYTLSFKVKKTTGFTAPTIEVTCLTGAWVAGLQVCTDNGFIIEASGSPNVVSYGVVDAGDHWIVWGAFVASSSSFVAHIYPTVGPAPSSATPTTIPAFSVASVGTARFKEFSLTEGIGPAPYAETTATAINETSPRKLSSAA